jgi:hypothetical protein
MPRRFEDDEEDDPRDLDEDEDRPRRRRSRARYDDDEDDIDAVSTFIPYKNGMALAAYYCGVFGLVPALGLVLGPIAFVLGILGIRYARLHPSAKGGVHAIVGIVLGAFSILYHIVLIVLFALGIIFK